MHVLMGNRGNACTAGEARARYPWLGGKDAMIGWHEVLDCFSDVRWQEIHTAARTQKYWSLSAILEGMTADEPDILYVCNSSSLHRIRFANEVSLVILRDDQTNVEEWLRNRQMGNVLLVLEKEGTPPKCIVALNAMFQEHYQFSRLFAGLEEAIAEGEGLQAMVEITSDFFHAPAAILDTAFRFLARSRRIVPQEDWLLFPEVMTLDQLDERIIASMKKDGLLQRMISENAPFFLRSEARMLCCVPMIISNVKVAHLMLIFGPEDERIKPEYNKYYSILGNMLSIELARNSFYLFNKGSYLHYMLSIILAGEAEVNDIRMRLRAYGFDLKEMMYLVRIETLDHRDMEEERSEVVKSLHEVFHHDFCVFQDGCLYYLLSRKQQNPITSQEIEAWKPCLEARRLAAAMTGPFFDFSDMQGQVRRLELLMKYNRRQERGENVLVFDDMQTQAMIASLEERDHLDLFMYPPVIALTEYDRRHHADLIRTLKEFLRHPREIEEICDCLHIHKNTLYKRLAKIGEILQCDYRDGENIMKIELTLMMLHL